MDIVWSLVLLLLVISVLIVEFKFKTWKFSKYYAISVMLLVIIAFYTIPSFHEHMLEVIKGLG